MNNLTKIGRIIFGLPFLAFGINHLVMLDFHIGMLTSFIPGGGFMIVLTGIALILAGISIITKKFIRISTLLLAVMLFLFIVTIHIPGLFAETWMISLIALLKDITILGGALMIAGLYGESKKEACDKCD